MSADRIVLSRDASSDKYVRITLLAQDGLVLAAAKLDLAVLRQAVLSLRDEATHVVKCVRDNWQQLGDVAAKVVEKVKPNG